MTIDKETQRSSADQLSIDSLHALSCSTSPSFWTLYLSRHLSLFLHIITLSINGRKEKKKGNHVRVLHTHTQSTLTIGGEGPNQSSTSNSSHDQWLSDNETVIAWQQQKHNIQQLPSFLSLPIHLLWTTYPAHIHLFFQRFHVFKQMLIAIAPRHRQSRSLSINTKSRP